MVRHEYAVLVSRRTGVDVPTVELALRSSTRPSPAAPPIDERQLTGPQRTEREMLRLLLANDPAVRTLDLAADLFSEPSYRAAFEVISELIDPLEPGVVPDLGSEIGSDDQPESALLRMLAMQQRPLPDADDVMKRLKQEAVERRIEEVQTELAAIDADGDAQGYSERFERLIALQKERRELRSRE